MLEMRASESDTEADLSVDADGWRHPGGCSALAQRESSRASGVRGPPLAGWATLYASLRRWFRSASL